MIITESTDIKSKLMASFDSQVFPKGSRMESIRKNAFSDFLTKGFPSILKNEDWKYTNVSKIVSVPYDLPVRASTVECSQLPFCNLEAHYLFFINGFFDASISSNPKEVGIHNLKCTKDSVLENYYNGILNNQSGFDYLNTALATDGAYIHLQSGMKIEKPIFLVFITDSRFETPFIQARNIIVAEKNNDLKIVELFISIGENQSLTNTVTEIFGGPNSHIDYTKINLEDDQNYHIGTTQFDLHRDATASTHSLNINGGFIRNNLNFHLKDVNCNVTLNGLYIPSGEQFMDNHTLVDHASPVCFSNELYKGIANDRATAVFNGKILVRRDAQKTNAYQRNMNILLSDDATVNTKPQLEIFADDVRCTHGATTGQMDEEAVFYLRSRGISEEMAKNLLMNAFAEEIIALLSIEELKRPLIKLISQKLSL